MTKTTRAQYMLEFKQEAVCLVQGNQSIAAAARTLGLVEQTLHNWVKGTPSWTRFENRRQAKDETLTWLLWYNQSRLHSTLA